MSEKKQFHLKIIWKNREKTEAHEIVLYDGGQPLCELISVDDARLVRDIMNEQEETIQTQKEYIIRMGHGTIFEEMKRLKERNQRQYERLKEITDLMCARDWKTLETMVDDWEQAEKQLEREWGTYSDLDD